MSDPSADKATTMKSPRDDPKSVKLFLDFDEVIQAPSADLMWSDTFTAQVSFLDDAGTLHLGDSIRWSPTLIRELGTIRAEHHLDLSYQTTWLRPASALGSFLATIGGLAGCILLRMPDWDGARYLPYRWKVDEVHRISTLSPGPFIWIDDVEVRRFSHEFSESELSSPSLTIAPSSALGLTSAHLQLIRAFCENLE